MPDIIKQIVDEEIELPGYPFQVSIEYSSQIREQMCGPEIS